VAPNGRKKGDDTLILALASGATAAGAAEVAKLSVRTVYRRLQAPEFRRRVDAEREALVTRTVGRLSALGVLASETLQKLLGATSDTVRLGAARAVLEFQFRGSEVFTLARAVAELREQVEALTRGASNHGAGSGAATGAGANPGGGGTVPFARPAAG
jgi:hypothetical protein